MLALLLCMAAGLAMAETITVDDITYTYTVQDDKATITKANSVSGDVVISEEINGNKVTCIGEDVFLTTDQTMVYIPEGCTPEQFQLNEYAEYHYGAADAAGRTRKLPTKRTTGRNAPAE